MCQTQTNSSSSNFLLITKHQIHSHTFILLCEIICQTAEPLTISLGEMNTSLTVWLISHQLVSPLPLICRNDTDSHFFCFLHCACTLYNLSPGLLCVPVLHRSFSYLQWHLHLNGEEAQWGLGEGRQQCWSLWRAVLSAFASSSSCMSASADWHFDWPFSQHLHCWLHCQSLHWPISSWPSPTDAWKAWEAVI